MVLGLVGNITNRPRKNRMTHREGTITILPRKTSIGIPLAF